MHHDIQKIISYHNFYFIFQYTLSQKATWAVLPSMSSEPTPIFITSSDQVKERREGKNAWRFTGWAISLLLNVKQEFYDSMKISSHNPRFFPHGKKTLNNSLKIIFSMNSAWFGVIRDMRLILHVFFILFMYSLEFQCNSLRFVEVSSFWWLIIQFLTNERNLNYFNF